MKWHDLAQLLLVSSVALAGCAMTEDPCTTEECPLGEVCEVLEDCAGDECMSTAVCVADVPPLTCASVLCIEGTFCVETPPLGPRCVLAQGGDDSLGVGCDAVDCPPGSSCTAESGEALCISDPLPPAPTSCAAVTCIVGSECIEDEFGARCVPAEAPVDTPASCAVTLCLQGTQCIEGPLGARCVPIDEPIEEPTESPCNLVDCAPAAPFCEVIDGEAVCLPEPPVPSSCAAVTCIVGSQCIEDASGARCVPLDEPTESPCNLVDCAPEAPFCEVIDGDAVCLPEPASPSSCAAVLCPLGTYCDDITGSAECLPLPGCESVVCESDSHCELQQVQCIRAPCPPVPACVPNLIEAS